MSPGCAKNNSTRVNKQTHQQQTQETSHWKSVFCTLRSTETMDSSPFVERPKAQFQDAQLEANTLRFKLNDAENQLALERLQHEEAIEALKKELLAEQKRKDDFASDQIFYYEANKELKSKLEHIQDNERKEKDALNKKLSETRAELNEYKELYEDLKADDTHLMSESRMQIIKLQSEVNDLKEMHEQLVDEFEKQVNETNKARHLLNEKDDEIAQLHIQIQSMPSNEDVDDTQLISKKLHEQMSYIQELEHKNLQQSEHIKQLTLNKTNTEILKNENSTLKAKLAKIDELNDTINDLNMELLQLREENNKWKVYLNEDDDVKIEEFVKEFKSLKDESLILKSNLSKIQSELKESKYNYNELFVQNETLQKNFNAISTASDGLTKLNRELEQQRDLAFEESTFLREQLKSFDADLTVSETDKDKYIANLESLIDEYKTKIENLTKSIPKEVSNKRPRSVMDDDEDTTRNFQKNITSLEQSNFDLETQVTRLMNENALLIKKLESIEDIKEQKMRILQLRNNPFMKDQMVKKEQLEVLKKENDDLLRKATFTETVPKSVYDRLQLGNQELEAKIYELNKKLQRLREIFSAKSLEFVEAIRSVIGYKVEFQKTGKITLHSKFSESDSIVVDPTNVTLKKIGSTPEFSEIWDRLIDFWIREKENLPCFLAALTLELYEKKRERDGLV